ncbi:hypothetical protein BKA70DRAFT_378463 [Coprinopsis sp. MPI-PUGE-AT-0042]|nr:hypothetical protein BKA70DRAFT_378463 [Coprinopsis sp. MPI-PUGE-AT-0042]
MVKQKSHHGHPLLSSVQILRRAGSFGTVCGSFNATPLVDLVAAICNITSTAATRGPSHCHDICRMLKRCSSGRNTSIRRQLPPLLLQCSLFLLTLIADFKSWIDSNKALRPHRPNASSIYTHIFRVFNATLMDSLSIAGETVLLEPHPRGTHRVLTHSLRDEIVLYSRTVYAVSRVLFDDFTALPGAHAECHPTFAIIFELLHNSGA